ncbi:FAD/NAD(P)-binding domain-containing protein, partial [Aureobasidium melanogenum]
LESASKIAEVGAGIQVLPNSSRVLIQWGLEKRLLRHATFPDECMMLGWKGERLSSMDFEDATKEYGTPFWDFHRADLHKALLDRAVELGASFSINARVVDVRYEEDAKDTATVILKSGERLTADLVVGADGIFSTCRELLLGTPSPPTPTGDLAYRVLLDTKAMKEDPELAPLLEKPHKVRYWMGPGAHAVNYVLRDGELFNMVLLVPDDMPADATTLDGNVEEMIELYKDWDPRIPKLLALCQSVQKWKLCFRAGLESSWSNEDATFVLLGDCVHATLPYLASGAGMSLEDGATLGFCLSKIRNKSRLEKKKALSVYEDCRRTTMKFALALCAAAAATVTAIPIAEAGLGSGLGGALSGIGNGAGSAVGGIGQGAGNGVSGIGQGAGSGVSGIGQGAGSGVSGIGQGAGAGVDGIGQGTGNGVSKRGIGSGAGAGVSGIGQGTGSGVAGIGQGTGSGVSGIGQGTGSGVSSIGQGTGSGVSGIGQGTGSGVSGIGQGAGAGVSGIGQGTGSGVSGIGQGTGSGVSGVGQGTGSAVAGIGGGLGGALGRRSKRGLGSGLGGSVNGIGQGSGSGLLGLGLGAGNGVSGTGQGAGNAAANVGGGVGAGIA